MKKSFYAVLPSEILTHPDLTDFDKLMYGLISSLANSKGYAWATNSYFEKAFNKSTSSIKRSIQRLIDQGFIVSIVLKDQGNTRRLYLSTSIPLGSKMTLPLGSKMTIPSYEKKTTLKSMKTSYQPTKKLDIEWFTQYVREHDSITEND